MLLEFRPRLVLHGRAVVLADTYDGLPICLPLLERLESCGEVLQAEDALVHNRYDRFCLKHPVVGVEMVGQVIGKKDGVATYTKSAFHASRIAEGSFSVK